MAQRISEVREQLESLQGEHDELLADFTEMIDKAHRHHDAEHPDPIRFCANPVCRIAIELEDAYGL